MYYPLGDRGVPSEKPNFPQNQSPLRREEVKANFSILISPLINTTAPPPKGSGAVAFMLGYVTPYRSG